MTNKTLLFLVVSFLTMMRSSALVVKEVLFDTPVSNHGARIRMIIKAKGLGDRFEIKSPDSIGGLKSPEYLAINAQGKMPLLLTGDAKYPIVESDTISRYVLDKYPGNPTFVPHNTMLRTLSNQVSRLHDVYVSSVQGCMYKPYGYIYSSFGTNRKAALGEFRKQLLIIESTLSRFYSLHPSLAGNYLCGHDISLADATLFPTMVFCHRILPTYFKLTENEYSGPTMKTWWRFMNEHEACAQEVRAEIEGAIDKWVESGRFEPIMQEMKA
ncbi:glutathione S-transferase family protein [archaeon]|nr:MAG: glutathione S-transferase family protein [archaeon]